MHRIAAIEGRPKNRRRGYESSMVGLRTDAATDKSRPPRFISRITPTWCR